MGSIFEARCPCGYYEPTIFSGSGMDINAVCQPGLCEHCRRIVTVRTAGPRLRFPDCRRKPQLVELYEEGPNERVDELGAHKCPKCGERRLTFENCGVWD